MLATCLTHPRPSRRPCAARRCRPSLTPTTTCTSCKPSLHLPTWARHYRCTAHGRIHTATGPTSCARWWKVRAPGSRTNVKNVHEPQRCTAEPTCVAPTRDRCARREPRGLWRTDAARRVRCSDARVCVSGRWSSPSLKAQRRCRWAATPLHWRAQADNCRALGCTLVSKRSSSDSEKSACVGGDQSALATRAGGVGHR